MIKSNCHTHTIYCDGKNTAEEMILAAIDKNFVSLGFSCHSPMIYENDWAIKKEKISYYINEINSLKEKYKDKIDILCGIEVDSHYCDVNLDDFEYTIGSVHQFIHNKKIYEIDYTAERLSEAINDLFDGDFNKMADCYFCMLADFICGYNLDVVGHFDLITKFNEQTPMIDEDNSVYQKSALAAIDKILEHNKDILFEVNTGAMFRKGNKKPYPAPFIMKHLYKKGAKITVTSDSHCCEAIDFAYDSVYEYCKSFGFKEFYILKSEGKVSVSF